MAIKVNNNAVTTLASGITAIATTLSVETGTGLLFPAYTTLYPTAGYDYSYGVLEDVLHNIEIVKVVGRTGDLFTIQRAQEGTTAIVFAAGSAFELRPTVQTIIDLANGLTAADIGVLIQAFDADTAKTDVAQTWTASQKSGGIADNNGSFDLSGAGNNYASTPSSAIAITFTNIAANANKSGYLTLVNSSAYAFTAHTNTKIAATDLTKIGATGTYVLPYLCDGTDVLILGAWKKP